MVYLTCDKYSSLWNPFFNLLYQQWPDFSLPIFSTAETKTIELKNGCVVEPVRDIEDPSWSTRLYKALKRVKTPYVILFLDDFLIKKPVITKKLVEAFLLLKNNPRYGAAFFAPFPKAGKSIPFTNFSENKKFGPYQISLQISLYKTRYLINLLRKGESPWEFEVCGSFRNSLSCKRNIAINTVEASPFCYDYGFVINKGMRDSMFTSFFEKKYGFTFNDFPIFDKTVVERERHHKKIYYFVRCLRSLTYKKYE